MATSSSVLSGTTVNMTATSNGTDGAAVLRFAAANDPATVVKGMLRDDNSQQPYSKIVYDALSNLFAPAAGSDQRLLMEFPGRVLDEQSYAYPVNAVYSAMQKPQPVVEKEFQLCDDLFTPLGSDNMNANIVGGPNGLKLSTQYEEALNLLIPKYDNSITMLWKDQDTMRQYLLELVPYYDQKQQKTTSEKVPRLSMFNILSASYYTAKADWEDLKLSKLKAARDAVKAAPGSDAMDEYARWVAYHGPINEADLQAKYADLVIHGYSHTVLACLGWMDTEPEAELLTKYKQQMRDTAMDALDGSSTVYPVSFQPEDWFTSLSTDYAPEDLLDGDKALQQELAHKCALRDQLAEQMALLDSQVTGDPKNAKAALQAAQKKLDDANTAMLKQFGSAAIALVQMYMNRKKGSNTKPSADEFNKLSSNIGQPPISDADFRKLTDLQSKAIEAQAGVQAASRELADRMVDYGLAQATTKGDSVGALKAQIARLDMDIERLKKSPPITAAPQNLLASGGAPAAGRWMDVVTTKSTQTQQLDTNNNASASQTSGGGGLWFMSGGWSDSTSTSFASAKQKTSSFDLELGFRATKVTFERGWFKPEVLTNTSGFTSLDPVETKKVLPSYPVAMIVVKDVTIKITTAESDMTDVKNVVDKASSWNVGFLCFSANHSESSHRDTHNFYSSASGGSLYIRIPGPQIIGWIIQDVKNEKDFAAYSKMPDNFLPATVQPTPTPGGPVAPAALEAMPTLQALIGANIAPITNVVKRMQESFYDLIQNWNATSVPGGRQSEYAKNDDWRIDLQGDYPDHVNPGVRRQNVQIQLNVPRRPSESTTFACVQPIVNQAYTVSAFQTAFNTSSSTQTVVIM